MTNEINKPQWNISVYEQWSEFFCKGFNWRTFDIIEIEMDFDVMTGWTFDFFILGLGFSIQRVVFKKELQERIDELFNENKTEGSLPETTEHRESGEEMGR